VCEREREKNVAGILQFHFIHDGNKNKRFYLHLSEFAAGLCTLVNIIFVLFLVDEFVPPCELRNKEQPNHSHLDANHQIHVTEKRLQVSYM
jgi:hypothetical protein